MKCFYWKAEENLQVYNMNAKPYNLTKTRLKERHSPTNNH